MAAPFGNKFAVGNTGGKPPFFDSPQKMVEAIDDYFQNGVTVKTVIVGKPPNQQAIQVPVPTITGLCYHIGFESRQSFYDYQEKDEFAYIVKRARLFIEKEYEEQLQVGNTVGAIFALKNMGWKDKTETDLRTPDGVIINFNKAGRDYETKE